MNKKELVDYISKSADLTTTQAEKALNGCLGAIAETLKNNDKDQRGHLNENLRL